MIESTYTIKPLEWQEPSKFSSFWEAHACGFAYHIYRNNTADCWIGDWEEETWICDSIDAAKAACERHYLEQMKQQLVESVGIQHDNNLGATYVFLGGVVASTTTAFNEEDLVNIDRAADGSVVGIEILRAKKQEEDKRRVQLIYKQTYDGALTNEESRELEALQKLVDDRIKAEMEPFLAKLEELIQKGAQPPQERKP